MRFFGIIQKGALRVFDRSSMDQFIHEKDGYVYIDIEHKGKRSVQQNRYYWAIMGILARHVGLTKDQMHDVCKMKFLRREHVIEETGEVLEYLESTTKLAPDEFNELVSALQIWAADSLGCVLPDPDEQIKIV